MKKAILIFIVILLLLSVFSCKHPNIDTNDVPSFEKISITLNEPNKKYSIITAEYSSEQVSEIASSLWMYFFDMKPGEIKSSDDWLQKGISNDNDYYEILVGMTNRPESIMASEQLNTYLDYSISVINNKICIYANTPERLSEAVEYFKSLVSFNDNIITFNGFSKYVDIYTNYPYPNMMIGDVPINEYIILISSKATNGERAFASRYANYIALNSGYNIKIVDDSTKDRPFEILIGNTNRSESKTATQNGGKIALNNNKLVVLSESELYLPIVEEYLYDLLKQKNNNIDVATDISLDGTSEELFLTTNYVAGIIKDKINYGAIALLSCCEYYNDRMVSGSKQGEKWVYSNKSKYVPQHGYFDDMLKTSKLGANCASPANWAFIDMGIIPSNKRFWGGSKGEFAHYDDVIGYISSICEIYDYFNNPIPFKDLYNSGKVKAGDVFLAKGHTFIYRGNESFYAAGHDSDWHSDMSVINRTEDDRQTVFDNWVCEMKSNSNYKCKVYYQIRFKDSYIPQYYRDTTGSLVKNPMYSK